MAGQETDTQRRFDCRVFSFGEDLSSIARGVWTLILDQNKGNESSEDEGPQQTPVSPPSNRKRKRVPASSSEDELAVDPRQQKYAKLNDSRLTAMDEEVRYSPVLKDQMIII